MRPMQTSKAAAITTPPPCYALLPSFRPKLVCCLSPPPQKGHRPLYQFPGCWSAAISTPFSASLSASAIQRRWYSWGSNSSSEASSPAAPMDVAPVLAAVAGRTKDSGGGAVQATAERAPLRPWRGAAAGPSGAPSDVAAPPGRAVAPPRSCRWRVRYRAEDGVAAPLLLLGA